ncbi:LexA family protein [Heliophilum fasciatum]|uniref:Repressor LexA n=1 Tax=Heliophilum fasciatum TaxID=35700 RepID=A0A4R2RYN9_9FIRM|nr:LexA family transcriptional regulator [Heliophilum fasciatum]MCW2276896.1 repressor LexA [Heliophilum fasciatum]TCP68644.1 repressor LexA [Heliophilum fasciatum]
MDVGKRLKKLRERKGVNQEEVANYLGLKRSTYTRYETNSSEADYKSLRTLADFFGTSVDYILGRMERDIDLRAAKPLERVPILGTIKAGIPLLADEHIEGEIAVPDELHADFALHVSGDSMSWAGISDGDIAILRQTDTPRPGMIVAAGMDDGEWRATLKFYVVEGGQAWLRAANPYYEDLPVGPHTRILGYVVSIQKQPPSLQDYRSILAVKEDRDTQWEGAIEKATQAGLSGVEVEKMVEVMAKVAKSSAVR